MPATTLAEIDAQYRQLREECAVLRRPSLRLLSVTGPEAGDYLQSQLTNDISPLGPGQGLYAALLNRKAHIQADMRVICRAAGDFLLLLEEAAFEKAKGHLEMYRIGREADVHEPTGELVVVSLIGPGLFAPEMEALGAVDPGSPHASCETTLAGQKCLAISAPIAGLPGLDLILEADEVPALLYALAERGIPEVSTEALEILRVEAGIPRYGHEIDDSVMPAEAGIVETAVSFNKGCYIGQEPVARLHYKGRPNRHLRRLALSAAVDPGVELWLEDRQLGVLTTSCVSPARGPLGLAVLRREAEPGTTIRVGDGEVTAEVEAIEMEP